ncbi:hypothetical protein SAMN05444280_10714 [Tangfeifania diversioriginum]|uniref:Uncharacterized protein n=1 Tax=Tangfeifania diversioriginum TaxID=1168035 RepID=A0A1M6EJ51_9BACT|nr:hypothetical protein SAMN05444280_10714 [Tangfeifania diversioriginum]
MEKMPPNYLLPAGLSRLFLHSFYFRNHQAEAWSSFYSIPNISNALLTKAYFTHLDQVENQRQASAWWKEKAYHCFLPAGLSRLFIKPDSIIKKSIISFPFIVFLLK